MVTLKQHGGKHFRLQQMLWPRGFNAAALQSSTVWHASTELCLPSLSTSYPSLSVSPLLCKSVSLCTCEQWAWGRGGAASQSPWVFFFWCRHEHKERMRWLLIDIYIYLYIYAYMHMCDHGGVTSSLFDKISFTQMLGRHPLHCAGRIEELQDIPMETLPFFFGLTHLYKSGVPKIFKAAL